MNREPRDREKAQKDMTINQRLKEGKRKTENVGISVDFKWNFFLMIYRLQIYEYSQLMDDSVEKEISCDVTLKIIDIILLNETSLNKPTVRWKNDLFRWKIDDILCFSRVFTASEKTSGAGAISDN